MANTGTSGHTTKECCDSKNKQEAKLMKATDLPSHGNPYPPKDVIVIEKPGFLESRMSSFRHSIQPYVSPFSSAFGKTQDFISIGVAHSQSSMQRLAENQSTVTKTLVISTAGLFGFALARRKGIFKKMLYGSVFGGGAAALCFPQDAEEKAQLVWFITKNKLSEVAKSQYQKLAPSEKDTDQSSQPEQK